jgi:hypothetical protein
LAAPISRGNGHELPGIGAHDQSHPRTGLTEPEGSRTFFQNGAGESIETGLDSSMRLRSLLWLFAVVGFLVPSFAGAAAASNRMEHSMTAGGGHEMPPPCPEKGTAKHAAGLCCALMACALAVLPAGAYAKTMDLSSLRVFPAVPHLTGLSPHKDPPPPRV